MDEDNHRGGEKIVSNIVADYVLLSLTFMIPYHGYRDLERTNSFFGYISSSFVGIDPEPDLSPMIKITNQK